MMNAENRSTARWRVSILLGMLVLPVYLLNRADPIGIEDTMPAECLPYVILRGDGPFLDRFEPLLRSGAEQLPVSMTRMKRSRHVISRYAPGGVLVHLPIFAAGLSILDRIEPKGWDAGIGKPFLRSRRLMKVSSGLLGALTVVFLHQLLGRLGVLGFRAVLATLAAALGSELWVVGSQAPWEHGPAAMSLTLAMFWLSERPFRPLSLFLGGIAAALMVCCRPLSAIFAVAILGAVVYETPRKLGWFLIGPVLLGVALLGYNFWLFGTPIGGLAELESLHPVIHGVAGPWSGRWSDGLVGTLFSPNRGLVVFSPWVVVAIGALPFLGEALQGWRLGPWMLAGLLIFLSVLSKYAVWWGGHCFGPRYWTEAMPIFAVLFGLALRRFPGRGVIGTSLPLVAFSIALQAIGALCFPSSWNDAPVNVDRQPSRAWDWSDTEIRRCLIEGVKPWSDLDDPLWHFPYRNNGQPLGATTQ